jgi:hypothetical protein
MNKGGCVPICGSRRSKRLIKLYVVKALRRENVMSDTPQQIVDGTKLPANHGKIAADQRG